MDNIKVVSFDLEGTLVTPDYSQAVWHEGIPSLYAKQYGIYIERAKAIVQKKYQEVGDQRKEWYDIEYWFGRFGLGDYRDVLDAHRNRLSRYPDASQALSSLSKRYTLIVATGTGIGHRQSQGDTVGIVEEVIVCLFECLIQVNGEGTISLNQSCQVSFIHIWRSHPLLI